MYLGVERRCAPRVNHFSDALVFSGEQRMFCRTVNLSATGLLLLPKHRARPGTELQLDFSLPCIDNALVEGVLTRETVARGLYAWGVRFVRVPTYIRAVLRDFVRQQLRGVPPAEMVFSVDEARRSSTPGYRSSDSFEAIGSRTAEDLERWAKEFIAADDSAGMYVKVYRRGSAAGSSPVTDPIPQDRIPRRASVAPAALEEVEADERPRASGAGRYSYTPEDMRVAGRRERVRAAWRRQRAPKAKAPPQPSAKGPRPGGQRPGPTRPVSSREALDAARSQRPARQHTPVEVHKLYKEALADLETEAKKRKKKGKRR